MTKFINLLIYKQHFFCCKIYTINMKSENLTNLPPYLPPVDETIGRLPIQAISTTLQKENLEKQKLELIDIISDRILECNAFLDKHEDSDDKKRKIEFIKKIEQEFNNFIEVNNFGKACDVIIQLYYVYQSWQPYCPIRIEAQGHYVLSNKS